MEAKISKNPLSIPEELRNWSPDLLGRLYELEIGEGTTPRSPKFNCMEYLEKFFKSRGQKLTSFDLKAALRI